MGGHAEYQDFLILNLPKYDAILGKAWLDRWNPTIDWKQNTMHWKVGTRLVTMTRDQDPQEPEIILSVFHRNCTVEQISVQRMKKLAKKEAVFLLVIRIMNEE